jgi:hypothetical protein
MIFTKQTKFIAVLMGGLALSLLTSCASTGERRQLVSEGLAKVDLRMADALVPNPVFTPRTSIKVPRNHKVGDKIFPYEGIGWENEIIGYRLYLDERSVTDIFGKKTPDVVLDEVDYRNDYHAMTDWGMDVMKVGPSMGVGGLGLYRGDSLERFGPDAEISATVLEAQGDKGSFKVTHLKVPLNDGRVGNVDATYSIRTGSPLTWVKVDSSMPKATLASGLVNYDGNKRFRNSNAVTKGKWRYIATWGDRQSEAKDGLGTVLFYRDGDARLMPSVNDTYPIRFNTPNPTYAFAGVWEQGPMGISDKEDFIAWVDAQQRKLNK